MYDPWITQRSIIRDELQVRGWSQVAVARELGITPKHLNQMLSGRTDGSLTLWVELAELVRMEWRPVPRIR